MKAHTTISWFDGVISMFLFKISFMPGNHDEPDKDGTVLEGTP